MKRIAQFLRVFYLITLLFGMRAVQAAPSAQVGPYRVEVTTEPETISIGKAQLRLKITDASGAAVTNAKVRTLTKMPSMSMGEREETATLLPDAPGVYQSPATFPMGGAYVVNVKISGPQGEASGTLDLQTGQTTTNGSSSSSSTWWLLGVLALALVAWRMKRTGQEIRWRALLHPQTAAGIAVLLAMFLAGRYAINHWRRPGSMTPLEAQGMEMNMPAPVGTTAVELATVKLEPLQNTVSYSGQAVGYLEQEVYSRVTGNLIWMPFYAGDKVKKGQLLARLDRSEIDPQIAAQRAAQSAAEQGALSAQGQYQQAQAATRQTDAALNAKRGALQQAISEERKARAQLGSKRGELEAARSAAHKARANVGGSAGAVEEARSEAKKSQGALREATSALSAVRAASDEAQSDAEAAREAKSNAAADRDVAQSAVTDARAQVTAAQADLEYWRQEIARMQVLVDEGAVSREEFQREQAQYETAQAKVRAAQARVTQVLAGVRGADSRIRRADAQGRAAEAKARQAAAGVEGALARIEQARAAISSANARVRQAQAGASGTGADVSGASARIAQMEADVRAARADIGSAGARVQQARAEIEAAQAGVGGARAAADVARSGIGQAQAGVSQAAAGVSAATTKGDYTEIRSLLDGVVTQRLISPGTLVSPGQAILKVAQINPIRVQANVAEADLNRVRVGSIVTVRDRDNKAKAVTARITSVAPSIDPQTRTGLVEAIVSNPERRLVPGEYVTMEIAVGQSQTPLSVPAAAIQTRAALSASEKPAAYVWVAEEEAGKWTVHPVTVQTGVNNGTRVEIRSGLKPGQRVVTLGARYLNDGDSVTAPNAAPSTLADAPAMKMGVTKDAKTQSASIAVTDKGFEPARVNLKAGIPARVTFTRKTEATCATDVVFPAFDIQKELPLNQPVTVEFTPQKTGDLSYACGMDMLRGTLVVQ